MDRGWVDYEAAEAVSQPKSPPAGIFERDGKRETIARSTEAAPGWEGSALVFRRGTLSLPVEIELESEDGTKQRQSWDGRESFVRVPYLGKTKLVRVIVDPDSKIVIDEDLFNNSTNVERKSVPYQTLERALYGAEFLLQLAMP